MSAGKKATRMELSLNMGFISRVELPVMFCVKLWVIGSWRAGNAGQRCNGLDGIGRAGQRVAPDECAIRVNRDNGRRCRTGNPEEARLLGSGLMNAGQQGQPDEQGMQFGFHRFVKKSAGRGAHTIPLLPAFFPFGKNQIASSARRVSSFEPEEVRAGGPRIGDDEGSARDGWAGAVRPIRRAEVGWALQ